MSFRRYSTIWPEVRQLFPDHFNKDILPYDEEVEAKIQQLYLAGNAITASKLSLWWDSIDDSSKPRKPDINMQPLPQAQPQELENVFENLSEQLQVEQQAEAPVGIRFKDFIVPLVVILLAIAFMCGAVVISSSKVVVPAENGDSRLKYFPQEPVTIAPEASIPTQDIAPQSVAPTSSSQYFDEINVYRINGDLTLTPNPTAEVDNLWKRALAVFGEDAIKLNSLGVAHEENSDGIAAYMDLDDRALIVNLVGEMNEPAVQEFTLVHEYNHLVTLLDQYEVTGNSCSTALLLEGTTCLSEESLLYPWIQKFWNEPGATDSTSTGDIEAGKQRFSEQPGEFVSVYAASAPQEDMAESFAAWVLGHELPQAKANFFNEDAESRALKDRILRALQKV